MIYTRRKYILKRLAKEIFTEYMGAMPRSLLLAKGPDAPSSASRWIVLLCTGQAAHGAPYREVHQIEVHCRSLPLASCGAALTRPDSWAGESVALGVVPLVEGNAGVVGLVNTRNLHSRPRSSGTAALNLELEALHVELRLADMALVETNVLHTNEVLARWDVLLNGPT